MMVKIERRYRAKLADLWALWTTPQGVESWWGPPGFAVTVQEMDLRPGGALRYVMTAQATEMVNFMRKNGMSTATAAQATYDEITPMRRLGYRHLVDFVPGHAAYETAMLVEFDPQAETVLMRLTFDAMHDAVWSERQRMGWEQELSKLATLLADRGLGSAV
jgi:uncharacterized protein YndB with AHSA1/START domain